MFVLLNFGINLVNFLFVLLNLIIILVCNYTFVLLNLGIKVVMRRFFFCFEKK